MTQSGHPENKLERLFLAGIARAKQNKLTSGVHKNRQKTRQEQTLYPVSRNHDDEEEKKV